MIGNLLEMGIEMREDKGGSSGQKRLRMIKICYIHKLMPQNKYNKIYCKHTLLKKKSYITIITNMAYS